MIEHPDFDSLDADLTEKAKGSKQPGDDELVAGHSGTEGELGWDEHSPLDELGDRLDAGAMGEILGSEPIKASSAEKVSAADVEHGKAPDVMESFLEVERRIKQLVEERRQLVKERDSLRAKLEEAMRNVAHSEEKISELLSIKDEYNTIIDQQEKVRTKVEGLLALLESEED